MRTRQQRSKHLRLIEKALVEGIDLDDVIDASPAQFGISPNQVANDLLTVYKRLSEAGARLRTHLDGDAALALAHRRRNKIWREAMAQGENRLAHEVEKDLCKLLGIYPQDRNENSDQTAGQETHDSIDKVIESELESLAVAREKAALAAAKNDGGAAMRGTSSG